MVQKDIIQLVSNALAELGAPMVPFAVERTEETAHGDYATNAAMRATKALRKSPMEIAELIAGRMRAEKRAQELFERIEAAKPGFVNFFLSPAFLQRALSDILKVKDRYGRSTTGQGKRINVEFVSANPTGPLTLANGRGGFFGDTLARVLETAGYRVTREYLVNDAGNQIKTLGESVLTAGGLCEPAEHHYQGAYIKDFAREFSSRLKDFATDPESLGRIVAEAILERMIKPPLGKAGIRFDAWTSEYRDIRQKGLVEKTVRELGKKGHTYEKDGAVWLKTSAFGDDKDRVLMRSEEEGDGPTYIAIDIPYHLEKWRREFDVLINVWGADHHGDVARLQAAMRMLGKPPVTVVLMQLVRLVEDGKEVRMSKRTGAFVTLEELLSEVGVDVARFFFLEREPNTHMDFDLTLAKDTSEKNPVYYAQYAYARLSSVLRKSKIQSASRRTKSKTNLTLLASEWERALMKKLIKFPELVEETARTYEVHRLPRYAVELAAAFHKFYDTTRVLGDNPKLTAARLALVRATQIVLKNTLSLMGIDAPERM